MDKHNDLPDVVNFRLSHGGKGSFKELSAVEFLKALEADEKLSAALVNTKRTQTSWLRVAKDAGYDFGSKEMKSVFSEVLDTDLPSRNWFNIVADSVIGPKTNDMKNSSAPAGPPDGGGGSAGGSGGGVGPAGGSGGGSGGGVGPAGSPPGSSRIDFGPIGNNRLNALEIGLQGGPDAKTKGADLLKEKKPFKVPSFTAVAGVRG